MQIQECSSLSAKDAVTLLWGSVVGFLDALWSALTGPEVYKLLVAVGL